MDQYLHFWYLKPLVKSSAGHFLRCQGNVLRAAVKSHVPNVPQAVSVFFSLPGKHRKVPFFEATVAGFRGKVDGHEQQLVFQVVVCWKAF